MKFTRSLRGKILLAFIFIGVIILAQSGTSMLLEANVQMHNQNLQNLLEQEVKASSILTAHYRWLSDFSLAVGTGEEFTGNVDPSASALGRWLESDYIKGSRDAQIISIASALREPNRLMYEAAAVGADTDWVGRAALLEETVGPRAKDVAAGLTRLLEYQSNTATTDKLLAERTIETSQMISLIIAVAALALAIAAAVTLIMSIVPPLRRLTRAAGEMALGKLDVDTDINSRDEIGELAQAFGLIRDATAQQCEVARAVAAKDLSVRAEPMSEHDSMGIALCTMLDNMNDMFGEIRNASGQVEMGSRQISDGAQTLAQGATEQAATITDLTGLTAKVEEHTNHNSEIAVKAAKKDDEIRIVAEKGSAQMDELMASMNEINAASNSISKVMKVIDDIAFQTNILALNAAVEAARAGQHGKGFAVVADEVRNLAAKSADAARDTGDMISTSIAKAELGLSIATRTAQSLREIVTGIEESSKIMNEIAEFSKEQTLSISSLHAGIDEVSQVVHQNSATSEQSAAASEQMASQAALLSAMIEQFRLRGQTGGQNAYDAYGAEFAGDDGFEQSGFSLNGDKY